MGREIAISIYLFVFRLFFSLFKLFPQKQTTVFVASFGDNILYTMKEVERQSEDHIVILKNNQCKVTFYDVPQRKVLYFESFNMLHWLQSIYHLATAQTVFVDNYYGFLAVTNFKPEVKCVQLWHAAGAIKQFGLMDLSIENRPLRAFKRFKKVYKRFDHVVVGSDNMAAVFREGFGISKSQLLTTGVPRTDFFYDEQEMAFAKDLLKDEYPSIGEKKKILYAPTYRDDDLSMSSLKLDLEKMYDQLKYDYIILLRLHPAVNGKFENKLPGFVHNVSEYPNINHLLTITDILVTDYSSIPFEFSLLKKPMIFFAYDLAEYEENRGFWENFEDMVPGPIVNTTSELIQAIKAKDFDMDQINAFAEEWNTYSNGTSSRDLVKIVYESESPVTYRA